MHTNHSIKDIQQITTKANFDRELKNAHTFNDAFLTVMKYYETEKTELGILKPVLISFLKKGIEIYQAQLRKEIINEKPFNIETYIKNVCNELSKHGLVMFTDKSGMNVEIKNLSPKESL